MKHFTWTLSIVFLLHNLVFSQVSDLNLQLFPGQVFNSTLYYFVARDAPGELREATYKLVDTSAGRWLRDINPKNIKSTWTLDPGRITHLIHTPQQPGIYTAGIIPDPAFTNASIFNAYNVRLTVTNTPRPADTISITARPGDTVTYSRLVKQALDAPNFGNSGKVYQIPTPDGLQRFDLVLRDKNLSWLKLSEDRFDLSRTDSTKTIQFRFSSPNLGTYETYMATYRQYRGAPVYTLIRFKVQNITTTALPAPAQIKIFPNPVNNSLNILTEEGIKIKTLLIFDLMGRCVYKELLDNQAQTIPLSLPSGTYLIKAETSQGVLSERLIIQKS